MYVDRAQDAEGKKASTTPQPEVEAAVPDHVFPIASQKGVHPLQGAFPLRLVFRYRSEASSHAVGMVPHDEMSVES